MEIRAWFVKKHQYWENHGKNWIARVTGLHKQYGYTREFLETVKMGKEKVFLLKDFRIGEVYEVASTPKRNKRFSIRGVFECVQITDTVVLQCMTQEEVIKRFTSVEKSGTAENLVHKLLKIVTKDQAVSLIETMGK
jgi:hypothetical protein